ncbi:hypothetical protein [Bacillus nakamurai]|uniref:hypothetical protein n=1 Tax=Bacillus nakamurai TaxID=1793963 RepID=UPI0020C55426|nr:hypothetical protein [Bacillus nakamurai]MCP6680726.1 hypothetical protein [Bacillus nakamurai]
MEYEVYVKKLNPSIEEEVTIEVNGHELTAFSSICPYQLEVGMKYPAIITFTILDKLEVCEIEAEKKELERIDSTYSYYIRGTLHDDFIESIVNILDEDHYFNDFIYLIGKSVEMKADRLEVEFLERDL